MTSTTKFSVRSLSSLFSWNISRQMSPRSVLVVEMPYSSGKEFGIATELTHFDEHLSYTSLRDLLPTSRPGSPVKLQKQHSKLSGDGDFSEKDLEDDPLFWAGGDRPPIKNRLVEQAARAYLLPTCSQRTPPDQFFARYWAKLTCPSVASSAHPISGNLWATFQRGGCINGCTNGCLSCLPTLIWVDLARVVQSLFSQLRPQSLTHTRPQSLLRDHVPVVLCASQ